jgi:hypothetical protein
MQRVISQIIRWTLAVVVLLGPLAADALACPMCRENLQENPALPRAFMASILFMLAMPATLLTGFGIGFYRLSKQAQTELPTEDEAASEAE